jgi:Uma2 family endonuclease
MVSLLDLPKEAASKPARSREEQRLLLRQVRWETYGQIRDDVQTPAVRMACDGTNLEILSPSFLHERLSALLGRFVERLAEERGIPLASGGATTFRRSALLRGLEPDRCYWLAHEPQVRGVTDFDPDPLPPPDLAIEVEISRSLLDRLEIYHQLGVPEIWRCDGTSVECLLRQPDAGYRTAESSQSFPWLAPSQIAPFLAIDPQVTESEQLRRFLEWSRPLG